MSYFAASKPCPLCSELAVVDCVDDGVGYHYHPDGFQCTACEWTEYGFNQPNLAMGEREFCPEPLFEERLAA